MKSLIINNPYTEPQQHWSWDHQQRRYVIVPERRKAGYTILDAQARFDAPGKFIELPLVQRIRDRIATWRAQNYPGVTSTTRRLLEHWFDEERSRRFFFAQREAIETLIWLTETPASERQGITIPNDGGPFIRWCTKMATGTGKTIVMAMVIAWNILNKVANPQDQRYSRYVLVVAPNLTVRRRLAVLKITEPGNYYETYDIVPPTLLEHMQQAVVWVVNWHALAWETAEELQQKRSVDKRGPLSDSAYARRILTGAEHARNILVINDEAHHAWRFQNTNEHLKHLNKEDIQEATVWVGGLDRIHAARGILRCHDFSATPFVPTGSLQSPEMLYEWIVSDYGLNDAIEAGLVKTPRIVVRDDALPDAHSYKSRLYHIYADPEVKHDLSRAARPQEPLPSLVANAYYLLGKDWLETQKAWQSAGHAVPPVMITVANRTETAKRIAHAFETRQILIEELCDPTHMLHIDSKVLRELEVEDDDVTNAKENGNDEHNQDEQDEPRTQTKKQRVQHLRDMIDTIGRQGQPGQNIKHVISVGMLNEGWDARNVTHIMGLRAFASQLLCEQVIGRGLRRMSYDIDEHGLMRPEYVNVFGVPFAYLTFEQPDPQDAIVPAVAPTAIYVDPNKAAYEIVWPHVLRVDRILRPRLSMDTERLPQLLIDARSISTLAELSPIIDGRPNLSDASDSFAIRLQQLSREYREQRIVYQVVHRILQQHSWGLRPHIAAAQFIALLRQALDSDRIHIEPPRFREDPLLRRLALALSMERIARHIAEAIIVQNTEEYHAVNVMVKPQLSPAMMRTWYPTRPCMPAN
ncbi:MAG: DEAD/DEAH box helicase family protein, partial [Rectinema sp.]|nr:DEAD/DEAH box helicase family protein [Rectinema sp.]